MSSKSYTYKPGTSNVNYLDASYKLLVEAFGREGTVDPRDDYKCEATWLVQTPFGEVEVYDYKVGKTYNGPEGLDREDITDWHVQGDDLAIGFMLAIVSLVGKATGSK